MSDLSARLAGLSPQKLELLRARLQREGAEARPAPAPPPPIEPRPEERHLPFPLTEVQEAYWAGRSGLYDLGGGGTSSYTEFELRGVNQGFVERLEWALQLFIDRHDMLRSVVLPDGRQRVLAEVPPFRIEAVDLRERTAEQAEAELLRVRDRMCYEPAPIDRWPLFEVLAHHLDGGRLRLHLRFDALLMDGTSRGILLRELPQLFADPEAELPPLACTYRDFAVTRAAFEQSGLFQSSRRYWLERLPSLPAAPELPLAVAPGPGTAPRLTVRSVELLAAEAWRKLKARALRAGLTPSSVALATYAEVIAAWSATPRFTLGLIGSDRPPVHPQIHQVFGNFNTMYLLAVDDRAGTFAARARRLQQRLTADFEHRHFSGIRALREANRMAGGGSRAAAPVFFNSLLQDGLADEPPEAGDGAALDAPGPSEEIEGSVHVPQVLMVPTLIEEKGALVCKWQAAEHLFAEGVAAGLLEAWSGLLARLAESDGPWNEASLALLPPGQRQARETAWTGPQAPARLQALREAIARRQPDALTGAPAAGPHPRVLDELGEPRPDWVAGDLWLGGHRTGLLARFLPGGEVEVLGPQQEAGARRASLAEPLRPAPPPAAAPVPPRDETETALFDIWHEILGTRPESVTDDFFALGGDSLQAVRLMARLRERFRVKQSLPSFLACPTLEHLARCLRQAEREPLRREKKAPSLLGRLLPTRAAEDRSRVPSSMRLYLLLWFSQFVSSVGTGLGSFALGVWVYRQNASATQYSLFAFVATCTALLVGPLAGVLADRWDRKRLILLGDSGAALMTSLMAVALYTGQLRLWHVYIIVVFMVGFSNLQVPALIAATSMLVPRRQLGRVAGLTQAAATATGLICPPLSGALVPVIGYHGVIMIDITTFLFAFAVLVKLRLPSPAAAGASRERRPLWRDLLFGWTYLRQRPGLLALLAVFAATNFSLSTVQVLLTPLVLSFGSATGLGFVNSAAAAGGLIGSLALGIWGGPRNRVLGVLLFILLQAPILFLGALQPSVMLIAVAAFFFMGLGPFVGGLNQAIWQSKVALDVQGRVFAMRGLIVSAASPLAYLLAGPLTDRFFEPLMAPGGALAGTVGQLIGVGKGRGVGLLFMALGLFIILVVLLSSLNPRLRKVEAELPDAHADPETVPAPAQREARLQSA